VSGLRGKRERGNTFSRKDSTSFWYFCGMGERAGRSKRWKREKWKSAQALPPTVEECQRTTLT
jgi:hypothetical protein